MLALLPMFGRKKAINYGRYIFCVIYAKESVDSYISIKFTHKILKNENGCSYKNKMSNL